jgi:hypothetical protein
VEEVKRLLRLYRERYRGWNVRHFFQTACREHGVKVSYTFVKAALQGAGLVMKHKARGRHRRRRERKGSFGEMLHLDGSRHSWLSLLEDAKRTLITVVDDAPVPDWVESALRAWIEAAGITAGRIFRAVSRWGSVVGEKLSTTAVLGIVAEYAADLGLQLLRHDLRRTCAKLCPLSGGALEQSSSSSGTPPSRRPSATWSESAS